MPACVGGISVKPSFVNTIAWTRWTFVGEPARPQRIRSAWISSRSHCSISRPQALSLYRTPAALEAAWKYFILCGVGIALALFGTILLYFAAEKVLGPAVPPCSGPISTR